MIVKPYAVNPAPPRLALLLDEGKVLDEDAGEQLLFGLEPGVQVWASQDRVLELLRQGIGAAICWRGQPIRFATPVTEGFRVRVMSMPFPADDGRALDGLRYWRDWLAGEGAAPQGSLGGTAFSLLRARVEREFWTMSPYKQAPPLRFTVGGRQELGPRAAPAEYVGSLRHFDMRAAYARTLAGLHYGGHWHKLRPADATPRRLSLLAEDHPVFCRARVTLTGDWPGPLVRKERAESQVGRFLAFPTNGRLQGVYTWQELEAAHDHGAKVTVMDSWAHFSAGWQPFQPWWRTIEQGREGLPGFAATIAKGTGNSLWGQFCVQQAGRRSILRYKRERGRLVRVVEQLPARSGPKPGHDLSELLTGVVRAELYRFIAAAGDRLCCAHTDGGWVDSTADGWAYTEPGWRLKGAATRLRVLDPQVLAYRPPGALEDAYVVSGWPAKLAAEQFEKQWAETPA